MALEDHLRGGEDIKFKSNAKVGYGDSKYVVYITNDRFILYANRGLVRSKDDIITWNLDDIARTDYEESGLIRKKGKLQLETRDNTKIELSSSSDEMKTIYQNCMRFIK